MIRLESLSFNLLETIKTKVANSIDFVNELKSSGLVFNELKISSLIFVKMIHAEMQKLSFDLWLYNQYLAIEKNEHLPAETSLPGIPNSFLEKFVQVNSSATRKHE